MSEKKPFSLESYEQTSLVSGKTIRKGLILQCNKTGSHITKASNDNFNFLCIDGENVLECYECGSQLKREDLEELLKN